MVVVVVSKLRTPFTDSSSFSDLTSNTHTLSHVNSLKSMAVSLRIFTGLNKAGNVLTRPTATRWRNVCTSQVIVTASYHFTRTERFDADFTSPATRKCT